jgi:hypothetical protein
MNAWRMSQDAYQAGKGVHRPWIAEISPAQYAGLSKRGKAQYDEKRAREWDASAACAREYHREVMEAFDRGEVTLTSPDLHPEARSVILGEQIERAKARRAEIFREASERNREMGDVRVGDVVYDILCGRYGTVTRKHKVSVALDFGPGPEWARTAKAPIARCAWLHLNELQVAVEHGLPIDRETLSKVGALRQASQASDVAP